MNLLISHIIFNIKCIILGGYLAKAMKQLAIQWITLRVSLIILILYLQTTKHTNVYLIKIINSINIIKGNIANKHNNSFILRFFCFLLEFGFLGFWGLLLWLNCYSNAEFIQFIINMYGWSLFCPFFFLYWY